MKKSYCPIDTFINAVKGKRKGTITRHLFHRTVFPEVPPGIKYSLTKLGKKNSSCSKWNT